MEDQPDLPDVRTDLTGIQIGQVYTGAFGGQNWFLFPWDDDRVFHVIAGQDYVLMWQSVPQTSMHAGDDRCELVFRRRRGQFQVVKIEDVMAEVGMVRRPFPYSRPFEDPDPIVVE